MLYRRLLGVLLSLCFLTAGRSVQEEGALWLDEPLVPWNVPGMTIPPAPRGSTFSFRDPECQHLIRPPETTADAALMAAGWTLIGAYQSGWQIVVVTASGERDGMCRPASYQGFVFVDGVFAGTVAPVPTFARTDGALVDVRLLGRDQVTATFVRYAATDPFCCPSRPSVYVSYRIEPAESGAVVVPMGIYPAVPSS